MRVLAGAAGLLIMMLRACGRVSQPGLEKWQCQISQQSMLNDSGCRGADAHCVLLHLQPFYSTERITELVRDCEQQLGGLLAEEQSSAPSGVLPYRGRVLPATVPGRLCMEYA